MARYEDPEWLLENGHALQAWNFILVGAKPFFSERREISQRPRLVQ